MTIFFRVASQKVLEQDAADRASCLPSVYYSEIHWLTRQSLKWILTEKQTSLLPAYNSSILPIATIQQRKGTRPPRSWSHSVGAVKITVSATRIRRILILIYDEWGFKPFMRSCIERMYYRAIENSFIVGWNFMPPYMEYPSFFWHIRPHTLSHIYIYSCVLNLQRTLHFSNDSVS